MAAQRCPNCTRKVRLWSNHSGFCSKRCRDESRSACLNCGKVGLFKHERLGCCSDECRYWYVTTLLGYDREYLLTPAWDKVVYHVRLPNPSAEISSLQLDELEYERAPDTILVVAAPAWISKQKVLAELPYSRFDNPAWQHLRADGTLSPEEVERFRGMCYDDPLLYIKLGEHVFEKIRGHGGTSPIMPSTSIQLAPGGVPVMQPVLQMTANMLQLPSGSYVDPATYATQATALPSAGTQPLPPPPAAPPLQLTQVSQVGSTLPAPEHFGAQIRALFALRGYEVNTANADTVNTLLLTKGSRRAVAVYYWHNGMVPREPVMRLLELMSAWDATHGYFVTNGHFPLQVEDLVAQHAVQLIDGDELAALVDGRQAAPAPARPTSKAFDNAMQDEKAITLAPADPAPGEPVVVLPSPSEPGELAMPDLQAAATPDAGPLGAPSELDLPDVLVAGAPAAASEPEVAAGRTLRLEGKPEHANGSANGATVRLPSASGSNGHGDLHLEDNGLEQLDVLAGPVAEPGARADAPEI
jgi:hypothetical protein